MSAAGMLLGQQLRAGRQWRDIRHILCMLALDGSIARYRYTMVAICNPEAQALRLLLACCCSCPSPFLLAILVACAFSPGSVHSASVGLDSSHPASGIGLLDPAAKELPESCHLAIPTGSLFEVVKC